MIVVGSVQERRSHPMMCAYAASKGALENFVRNVVRQVASEGITVNNLYPGVFYTDRNKDVLSNPEYAKQMTDAIISFSEDSDRLELLSISSLSGELSRDFEFLPGGCLALVTLEGSGRGVSLSCDAETGRMFAVDSLDGFFRPSSVTVPAR